MKLKDTPIQVKLMRVMLFTTGAALVLACASFLTYEFYTFRENIRNQLHTVGMIVSANSTTALTLNNRQGATEILDALKTEKHIVAAALYDRPGRLFAQYPAGLSADQLPQIPAQQYGYRFTDGYIEGFEIVMQNGQVLGTLYLKSDLNAMNTRLLLYGGIALLVICISFLLAYIISKRLQQSISRPILNLAETAKVISDKYDYSVRAVKSGNDELGLLTDAFNHMLTQIELQNLEILLFNQKLEQKVVERTEELRTANHELQRKNQLVETILDSSVYSIVVLDTEMRFTVVNKQFSENYQKDKGNVIGRSFLEVFPAAIDSKAYRDIQRAIEGQYIHNEVVRSAVAGGYFENYYIPLYQDGKVYSVLILAHEITNIIEANEKLKLLNEQLVKSNHDLEQFAYVASHDLQEPLRKIQTFGQLAQKEIDKGSVAAHYLGKVTASAKRMTELINEVLNYSRLSKKKEEFADVDLNQVMENIKTDLELLIEQKNAVVQHTALPVIQGISLQLNQLFFNLIGNSLKFSEKPPVISVTAKVIAGRDIGRDDVAEKNELFAELIFSDNGVGFEQQYAERIFTIFQRLHDKQSYTGTGIGLALCKKIVENHNGYISAESKPGEGAAFYVYLPLQHKEKTEG